MPGGISLRPAPLLLLGGAAWTALVIAAPVLGWSVVYRAAHLVCHQIPSRSFFLDAAPLAVCARCLGLYLGALAGGTAALVADQRVGQGWGRTAARTFMTVAALPTALTLVGEWGLDWPIGNAGRFAAALPLGVAAAWLVVRSLEVDWRA